MYRAYNNYNIILTYNHLSLSIQQHFNKFICFKNSNKPGITILDKTNLF